MEEHKRIHFFKMNGLGNEILVMDLRGTKIILSGADAKVIASQPRTHFDQLMVLRNPHSSHTDAQVTIYNADGSESGACGNGTRCIGWLEKIKTGRSEFTFETQSGFLGVKVQDINHITVDMGEPRFAWKEIPLSEPREDTTAIALPFNQGVASWVEKPSVINVGNPHVIFWVKDVESCDLVTYGPLLEKHPLFPERANISVAEVQSPKKIKIRTWERGVGLTRACGTAACAAAISAMRRFNLDHHLTVLLPGGVLEIAWTKSNQILMSGPVELEYEGDWP